MSGAPKVLFLGLDSMDSDLAFQWAERGELPALAALRDRAVWGPTRNPDGFYVGGVWPSFNTASTPARHGHYCWKQFDPASYRDLDPPGDDGDAAPWWHAIERAGREAAIVDLPRATFAPDFRGLQLYDWGTHDPSTRGFCTSPPEFAAEILERYGSDPVGVCDTAHQLWHLHDAEHPRHDPALAQEVGDPLLQVYRGLDRAIADLRAAAGPETALIVLLSHGAGPHYDGDHLIDEALARIEKKLRYGRSLRLAERVSYLARARHRDRRPIAGRLRRWPERTFRRSFRVPNNEAVAGIRINLEGREAHGRIRPGAERDAYCEALAGELLLLRNAATGGPAFRRVERCDQLYPAGSKLPLLPDLIAEWTRDAEFQALESATVGRIEGRYRGVRTGDHRPHGLFLATGPGLTPGRVANPVSVMDFGPTIAARLGVKLGDVDGEPIRELLAGAID